MGVEQTSWPHTVFGSQNGGGGIFVLLVCDLRGDEDGGDDDICCCSPRSTAVDRDLNFHGPTGRRRDGGRVKRVSKTF